MLLSLVDLSMPAFAAQQSGAEAKRVCHQPTHSASLVQSQLHIKHQQLVAGNRLRTSGNLMELQHCPSLISLDLSSNSLEEEEALEPLFSLQLALLKLTGNPLVSSMRWVKAMRCCGSAVVRLLLGCDRWQDASASRPGSMHVLKLTGSSLVSSMLWVGAQNGAIL